MNYDNEDLRWKLDVAQVIYELEARQNVIAHALVDQGYFTVDEFLEKVEEKKKEEHFKKGLEKIRKTREELAETPTLSQIFAKFMEGNKDGESVN